MGARVCCTRERRAQRTEVGGIAPDAISLLAEQSEELQEDGDGLGGSAERCAHFLHDVDRAQRVVELPRVRGKGQAELLADNAWTVAELVDMRHERPAERFAR